MGFPVERARLRGRRGPPSVHGRRRRARAFLDLTTAPPSPGDTEALTALYGAFERVCDAAADYPPLAVYLHASATAGFHEARTTLSDPRLSSNRGRFIWVRGGFARGVMLSGFARVRRAVAHAFPSLARKVLIIGRGGPPRGGAYRSVGVEPSASDDRDAMLEAMGLAQRFECARAHGWFVRLERASSVAKGSLADAQSFGALWQWHDDAIRRVAAEAYALVHGVASTDPIYCIAHGAGLVWASIQAVRVHLEMAIGIEDALAACDRLRKIIGSYGGVGGTLTDLAKAIIEHRPGRGPLGPYQSLVASLAAKLEPQGFTALYGAWSVSLEVAGKIESEHGPVQETFWESLNVFGPGRKQQLRHLEAQARERAQSASSSAAAMLRHELQPYAAAALYFDLEEIDLRLRWIRVVPGIEGSPPTLAGVDEASEAIAQWALRARAFGTRLTAGELIERFAANALPGSRVLG